MNVGIVKCMAFQVVVKLNEITQGVNMGRKSRGPRTDLGHSDSRKV